MKRNGGALNIVFKNRDTEIVFGNDGSFGYRGQAPLRLFIEAIYEPRTKELLKVVLCYKLARYRKIRRFELPKDFLSRIEPEYEVD